MAVIDLAPFNAILQRLESAADRLERGTTQGGGSHPGATGAAAGSSTGPVSVPLAEAFDAAMVSKLQAVQDAAANSKMKDLTEGTAMFAEALQMARAVLVATGQCKKPEAGDWPTILRPIIDLASRAQKACDNRSDMFQNTKALAESLNVAMFMHANSPPSHVQTALETMEFHGNKVLMKKKPEETEWIKALKAAVQGLKDFCTEHCKLGLPWKPAGQDPKAFFEANPISNGAGAAAASAAYSAAPTAGAVASTAASGMDALKAGLNAFVGGPGVLKKVTPEMKTKNRDPNDVAPAQLSKQPVAVAPKAVAAARASTGPKGPPIKELQKDVNWVLENWEGQNHLVIEEATLGQSVCLVNCKNCTLQVKSKVKAITIDGCERCNVICQDVLSAVELVNCERSAVQTTGKVLVFQIDKCNGVQLHLPKESKDAKIVTSKSSEMNVNIPHPTIADETIELPIPEQFVTTLAAGGQKLSTGVSDIYSS